MAKKGQKFKNHSLEFKIKIIKEYLSCESGGYSQISKKYNLSTSRIHSWVKIYQEKGSEAFLIETRGRNSKGRPKSIKLEEMPLEEQVEYLKMIKNGKPMHKCWDEKLAEVIKDIFEQTKKGNRFITHQLKRYYGLIVNRKTVLRYMQILGIKSPIRKSRFECCTQEDINEKARIVHNNFLARNFEASRPLEKLVTDVSYVYHKTGRLYLSVIKDLYDNSILAYSLSKWNSNALVFDNLNQVFTDKWDISKFCILHSDRGYQYTNINYIKFLDNLAITISHSRKANCYDNSCCENFFSHLKSEWYRHRFNM